MQHRRFLPFVAVACIALGACAGGGDQGNNTGTTDQSAAGSVGGTGTVTDTSAAGRDTMRDSLRDTARDTTTNRPRNP